MREIVNVINEYVDEKGVAPYSIWLDTIKDKKMRAIIIARVDRMELNNFGDSRPVGEGISELRIHMGPGYRVYYAQEGRNIYILLCGGDKSSQSNDIKLAKKYWASFDKG